MRMPILSYFTVAGIALLALLFWVSNGLDPNSSAIRTSQIIGVPEPFKAQPEKPQYTVGNLNFAAEAEDSATKPTQAATPAAKPKTASKPSKTPKWNRVAETPHDEQNIH
jgi:hypothetical protein